jgi:RHS repeat-associated protein
MKNKFNKKGIKLISFILLNCYFNELQLIIYSSLNCLRAISCLKLCAFVSLLLCVFFLFPKEAFCNQLVFSHNNVNIFAIDSGGTMWYIKPPLIMNSSIPPSSGGLIMSYEGQSRVWTNNDEVNIISGSGSIESTISSLSLIFALYAHPWVTVDNDPATSGTALRTKLPNNLSREVYYLENHVIDNDLENSDLLEYCNYGDGRIEFNSDGTNETRLYIKDHLGSTRAVENLNGTATEQVVYDAYGSQIKDDVSANENEAKDKFTGKELYKEGMVAGITDELRLNYFGARYYDAEVGRWINTDPAEQFYDAYNYCGTNPINGTDPDGSSTCEQDGVVTEVRNDNDPTVFSWTPESGNDVAIGVYNNIEMPMAVGSTIQNLNKEELNLVYADMKNELNSYGNQP